MGAGATPTWADKPRTSMASLARLAFFNSVIGWPWGNWRVPPGPAAQRLGWLPRGGSGPRSPPLQAFHVATPMPWQDWPIWATLAGSPEPRRKHQRSSFGLGLFLSHPDTLKEHTPHGRQARARHVELLLLLGLGGLVVAGRKRDLAFLRDLLRAAGLGGVGHQNHGSAA